MTWFDVNKTIKMTTFSIASPTSGKKKSKPIDWKACFICQDINVEQNLVKPFERPGKYKFYV